MHDSGAQWIASLGKLQPSSEQRIHQRAGWIACAGMHGHSRGLVDGDDVFIFVQNFERNRFCLCGDRWALAYRDGDFFAAAKPHGALFRCAVVYQNKSGVNQLLHASTAEFRTMLRDDDVEPPACLIQIHDELMVSSNGGEKSALVSASS